MCPQKSVTVVFRVANLTELKFKYLSNDMNYILYIYIYILIVKVVYWKMKSTFVLERRE
jgi:hypothetical protein